MGLSEQVKQQDSEYFISAWCHHLRAEMSSMFETDMKLFIQSLPKLLVDESEKLPSLQQQPYFDIVSMLQSNKKNLNDGFTQAILITLETFEAETRKEKKEIIRDQSFADLSLIDADEIEVGIVLEGQAGKVASKMVEELNDAYLRISQIVPQIKTSSQLPVHPKALMSSMLESFTLLSLLTEHKIILLKLFSSFISTEKLIEILKKTLSSANIPEYDKRIINKALKSKGLNNNESQDNELASADSEDDSDFFKKSFSNNRSSVSKSRSHFNPATQALKQPHANNLAPSSHNQDDGLSTLRQIDDMSSASSANLAALNQIEQDLLATTSNRYSTYAFPPEEPVAPEYYTQKAAQRQALMSSNAEKSAALMNQLGSLRNLRHKMATTVPIVPDKKHEGVKESVLSMRQLDGILQNLQQQQSTVSVQENAAVQSAQEVRTLIRDQLVSDDDSVQTINEKDSDIINLVSMLFDEILDNPNLSNEVKALLARLQIPILRVALKTPNFIARTDHPSRKLLDKLAEAGISCAKSTQRDKFFEMLESIVFRVLKDFKYDQEIFKKLYEELDEYLKKERKQSKRVEIRTREKEQKKAESQLAKSEVQKQLNKRLLGKKIPFCVVKIIQNGWWQVLYHTNIRYGIGSDKWQNALKVVDALIWSVTPPNDGLEAWQAKLSSVQDKLIKNLESGLKHIHFDLVQQSQLLRDVKQIHQDLLEEREVSAVTVQSSEKQAPVDDQFKVTENEGEDNVLLPVDAVTVTLKEKQASENTSDEMKQMSDRVKKLKTGDWVEFDTDTDEPKRRKLVAKVRTLNKLVFTNRRGIKVAEVTNTKLARLLKEGKAKLIENDAHIVDTAIGSVLESVSQVETLDSNTSTAIA